ERSVLLRHLHQLATAAPLGRDELDPAPAPLAQPLEDERGLRNLRREQELGRGYHAAGVELPHESGEHLPVTLAGEAIEEEGFASEQPALANEEELHTGVGPLPHEADDVLVGLLGGDDLL